MGTPFLEQDTGAGADITSELVTGQYTTGQADAIYHCDFRISAMGGQAATVTARLAHTTSADVLIRNYYYSMAKHTAANTVFGGTFADIPVITSGDKLKLYLLSSNANDSAVAWQVDWIDARASNPTELAGSAIVQTGGRAEVILMDDAITSGKFDETTAFPIKSVDSSTTQITRVSSQPGLTVETYNVDDGTNPIQGALVKMTSDAAGSTVLSSGYTDSSGDVTLVHDKATGTTLYFWVFKAGYTHSNPDTETAS